MPARVGIQLGGVHDRLEARAQVAKEMVDLVESVA
jgi:hypothetical protein